MFGPIFGTLLAIILIGPAIQVVRKAGFSGWWIAPLVLFFPVSCIVFATASWPVHRELAWLRMRASDPAEPDYDLVERYAVDQENRGDWDSAIEVYEALARRSPKEEGPDYYRNCAKRLRLRQAEAAVA